MPSKRRGGSQSKTTKRNAPGRARRATGSSAKRKGPSKKEVATFAALLKTGNRSN